VNLILALVWLTSAITLFVWDGLAEHKDEKRVLWAYFALALFVYNLVRWWLWRLGQRRRQEMEHHPGPPPKVVNPEFDFSREAGENEDSSERKT
jgi:hypothetical protein